MIDYIFVFLVVTFVIIPFVGSHSHGYTAKGYVDSFRDGWLFVALAGAGLFAMYLFFSAVVRILTN